MASCSKSLIEKLEGLKERVYFVDGQPNLSPFANQVNAAVDQACYVDSVWWDGSKWFDGHRTARPTHWMPIPKPPTRGDQ